MKSFEYSQLIKNLPEQFFATLSDRAAEAEAEGRDIINFGQGNPDQPTPEHIIRELQSAAEKTSNHKYAPFRGKHSAKQAVADFYKREYDVDLDPETEVALLFGAKAGLVELQQCLLNPGDGVLLPDPGYPDYLSGAALSQAEIHTMPLTRDKHFLPDYAQLSDEVKQHSKLAILNYPNNPTGALADQAFFNETIQLAHDFDIGIVHDFAYGAIGFDGERPISFLEHPEAKNVGVEMYTLSKTYNMAGWRVGFAVGNPSMIEAINIIQDHLYCSLFGAVQDAAVAALTGPQDEVDRLNEMYESRRNTLIKGLNDIGWEVEAPKGSFFAWFKVPEGYTSASFTDLLLKEADVLVAPGHGFGEYGEGYVRVGLLTDEERMKEAIERIKKLDVFS
ncbi:pyridoxal phosphate-dependent aminotransferase [Thalassobacillus sp. CUG 92003]|uniref:pyridoxal phosphate-dependent aminotransferase n=1 Tax=Thalassobacillus sp. CUG 92003 TaxID=2736641 RepID=UPI0015E6E763|nr:pyridoxal phosphate-dependent aminotransferase [Thalassobacillus sp. CUG 92003]